MLYKGWPDTPATERQLQRIADKYCLEMKRRWGIVMVPHLNIDDGTVVIGAEPQSELDAAMLDALMQKEGLK